MRALAVFGLFAVLTSAVACSPEQPAAPPAPFALTQDAMGRYCGMNVLEHEGPKGQIILAHFNEPIWFSSARDTIAFTMLPDEPKDVAAIYVSDMAVAPDWANPGADNWIDARAAYFVIGSDRKSGMNADEAVPFSTEAAATAFTASYGGHVVGFADIPVEYILGDGDGDGDASPHTGAGAHP